MLYENLTARRRRTVSNPPGATEKLEQAAQPTGAIGELFYTLKEAQIIIERWRVHDNTVRPHSSLGGQPPAPEAIQLAS